MRIFDEPVLRTALALCQGENHAPPSLVDLDPAHHPALKVCLALDQHVDGR